MKIDPRARPLLLAFQVLLLLSLLAKQLIGGGPLCWVFLGVGIAVLIVAVGLQLAKENREARSLEGSPRPNGADE